MTSRFDRLAWLAGLLLLALGTLPPPALASAAPATGAAAQAKQAAPAALTPAEAQRLLSVLNDPARRIAFIGTLNLMAKAIRPATKATPAALVPNSLGAEILISADALGANLAHQSRDFNQTWHEVRRLRPWLRAIADDPARRGAVGDALIRLAVVLGTASAAVWLVMRALRGPMALIARLASSEAPPDDRAVAGSLEPAPQASDRPEPSDPPEPADPPVASEAALLHADATARQRHKLNFVRMLHALRRLPFAAARLVLELVPVLGFALVGLLFETVGFVARSESILVVSASVRGFVVAGALIASLDTLFSPHAASLRLILVRDAVAQRVSRWIRRMIAVGAIGYTVLIVLQTLGLPDYAVVALGKLVVFVEHTLLAGLILASRRDVAARLTPSRRIRDGALRRALRRLADRWWLPAIFFDYAFWLIYAAQLQNGYARLWTFTIDTLAVIVAAHLLRIALLGGLERGFRVDPDTALRYPWLKARTDRYYPLTRRFTTLAVVVVGTVSLLQVWGLGAFGWFAHGELGGRLAGAVVSSLIAAAIGVLIWEAVNTGFDRHLDHLGLDPLSGAARVARVRTLLPILRILLFVFIATVVALTIMSQIGLNIAPLLGGAGIIGVAIGFGSQKLVQDFITGIFLLLENAMQVGDWVTAAGLSGSVEHLSIRTIRLRAGDGSVHLIPFSSVSTVTNINRGVGNAAVSVDIAHAEDTDRAGDILKSVALELRETDDFKDGMLSDLQYWGVDKVTGGAVTLVGQIVCTDKARWGVQREFNRRMKQAFEAHDVRLAVPRQEIAIEAAPPPARPTPASEDGATLTESPPPTALGHDQ